MSAHTESSIPTGVLPGDSRSLSGCAKGLRVLLVDDAPDIRTIVRLSLERVAGWEVVAVESGEAALEIPADGSKRFDVVLLDVMMPGLDGPSTLLCLREGPLPAAVPVVFLTAKARESERARLRALGAVGVITKPFDPLALPGEIVRVLERQEPVDRSAGP